MPRILNFVRESYSSIEHFMENTSKMKLRSYQVCVAQAIIDSIIHQQGLSMVVMFPRQSGKNEVQAVVECYLLTILSWKNAEIIKISPTGTPQNRNAMRRLEQMLNRNLVAVSLGWSKEGGYIYKVRNARMYFLSGAPTSNIVGATASTLLEVDEAQDVSIDKFDKEIVPMVASSNATRVFWGTAWTSRTLLARELAAAQEAEKQDGIRRTFVLTAEEVAAEVPAYGKFVREQIARLGRNNPMVRSQYFSEAIEAEGGMFNGVRRVLMQGRHPAQAQPTRVEGMRNGAGMAAYAVTIDVAGEDEGAREEPGAGLRNPDRDATALTIFEVEPPRAEEALISKPIYKVVQRQQWTGIKHTALFRRICAIIDVWQPSWIVVDATGVGQTLASFLFDRYPNVMPFTFTSSSKSALGWAFLALIETGRYKEYAGGEGDRLQAEFWRQVENTQYAIQEGPGKVMRWGVPDGTRDPGSGEVVHDDLVMSAALVSQVDGQPLGLAESIVVPGPALFEGKEF